VDCLGCVAGRASSTRAASCILCEPGTYAAEPTASFCQVISIGFAMSIIDRLQINIQLIYRPFHLCLVRYAMRGPSLIAMAQHLAWIVLLEPILSRALLYATNVIPVFTRTFLGCRHVKLALQGNSQPTIVPPTARAALPVRAKAHPVKSRALTAKLESTPQACRLLTVSAAQLATSPPRASRRVLCV